LGLAVRELGIYLVRAGCVSCTGVGVMRLSDFMFGLIQPSKVGMKAYRQVV